MEGASVPAPEAPKRHHGRLARVLLVLTLLAIVFVGLWGFVPVHVDEEVPANLRVVQGEVVLKKRGQSEWRQAKGLASLPGGSSVRVEAGADAFLVHFDGGVSRLTGPVEVQLAESRRKIDGPSTFGGVLVRLLGKEPTGHVSVSTNTALRMVAGTLVSRASSSANSKLLIIGPNYRALAPPGAAFRTGVVQDKETWWESLKGTTGLGTVNVTGDTATPVVIPALGPGSRILMPNVPAGYADNDKVKDLSGRLAKALPQLKGTVATTVEGIAFRVAADSPRVPYLVGNSIPLAAGPATAPAAPGFKSELSQPASAETLLAVPGMEQRAVGDAEISNHLPSGVKAHVVDGNVVEVTYLGAVYTVRVDVVEGKLQFSGLPLGLDPGPQLERFGADVPMFLSVETREGEARLTYFPEGTTPTSGPQNGTTEEVPLVPHTTPYFASIPTPDEVSTDWRVVGANGLLAAWAMFLVRILTTLASTLLRTQEANLKKVLSPAARLFQAATRVPRDIASALSRRPASRSAEIAGMVLLYGLVFSFLDARFAPWAGKGLNVLPAIALSTAFVGQIDPTIRSMMLTRWGIAHSFGIYPANLGIAISSVAFSRVAALTPGILIGTPGGLKATGLQDDQKYKLALWGTAAVFGVGMAAWAFTFVLPRLSLAAPSVFASLKGPVSLFQDVALLVFAAALTRVFFGLLPLPQGTGATVWKKSKVLWLVSFGIAAFIFFHTLFNRNNGLSQLMEERGALVLGFLGLSMALAVVALLFSRRRS